MADGGSPLDAILMELGLDLGPLKEAASVFRQTLADLQSKADQLSTKATEAEKGHLAAIKASAQAAVAGAAQQITEQEKLRQIAKAQMDEYRKQEAAKKSIIEAGKGEQAQEAKKLEALKLETAELDKQKAVLQQQTAALAQQIAQIRLRNAQGGSGAASGVGSTLARSLFGGQIGGALLSGGAAGAAFAGVNLAVQGAVHGIEKFYDKLKQASVEAGKFTVVSDTFERIAHGAGADAARMIEDMRWSTEGLVDKFTLMKLGIAGFSSSAKLSSTQISQFVGDVVKLAEAQGVPIERVTNGLQRMLQTGQVNFRRLGINIDNTAIQLTNLGKGVDPVTRKILQMEKAIQVAHERALKLGELPMTLEQMEKRIHVLGQDLFNAFGKGFNESDGAQVFIRFISGNVEAFHKMEDVAEAVGKKIGMAMAAIGPVLEVIKQFALLVWEQFRALADVVGAVFELFGGHMPTIKAVGEAFIYMASGIQLVSTFIRVLAEDFKVALAPMRDFTKLVYGSPQEKLEAARAITQDLLNIPKKWADNWQTETDRWLLNHLDRLAQYKEAWDKAEASLSKKRTDIERPDVETGLTAAQQRELDRLRLQNKKKADQEEAEDRKEALEEDKRTEDTRYRDGEIRLEEHLTKLRDIAKSEDEARKAKAFKDYRATMDDIALQAKEGNLFPGKEQELVISAEHDLRRALTKSEEQLQKELYSIEEQGAKDRRAARLKQLGDELSLFQEHNQKVLALYQEQNRIEAQQNEKRFSKGEISPDDYFGKRVQLTDQMSAHQIMAAQKLRDEQIKIADEILAASVKNANDQETRDKKVAKAREDYEDKAAKAILDAEKGLTEMLEDQAQKRLDTLEKFYTTQQKGLETRIAYQQGPEAPVGQQAEVPNLLEQLTGSLQLQRVQLLQLIQTVQPYSDLWYQIYDRIEQTYQSQIKYNDELEKTRDLVLPISRGLESMSKLGSSLFGGRSTRNIFETVGAAAAAGPKIQEEVSVIKGAGPKKDPAMVKLEREAGDLFKAVGRSSDTVTGRFSTLTDAATNLASAVQAAINKLNELAGITTPGQTKAPGEGGYDETSTPTSGLPTEGQHEGGGDEGSASGGSGALQASIGKMIAGVQALVGIVNTISGAKSAGAGILGGGLQAAQLGNELVPGIGAAVGAVVGGIMGGIVGHKNAEVKKNMDEMNAKFKDTMNIFANNTNNLQNTIVQLQGMVQQVKEMQSSSKKGHSDYQKLIDQYNDQLTQLQRQQMEIRIEMEKQLAILQVPVATQGYLSSLKDILEQYQKFEGAAQSAKDLADANQFLVASLQQYEENLSTTLATDNEKAINDALQLNDLIYQRGQLLLQFNQQVSSIMSQGVLTRTQTRAQTIGQQVQQLQVAFDRQMEQMDEQISATQYRVTAEQQIFQISSTRVGLEAQLLQLQNRQTDVDMVRIASLAALVSQLQNQDFGSGALGQLLQAFQDITNPAGGGTQNILQALMGLASSVQSQGSAQSLDDLIAAAYQDRASAGYAEFRSTNL